MEQIFKDNPRLDEVYQTSDGKFFYLENDARNHASKLENKRVEKLIRPLNTGDEKKIEGAKDEKKEAQRAEKITELQALDLVKENYKEMKALIDFFEIETKDKKAETFIEALFEFKQNLIPIP